MDLRPWTWIRLDKSPKAKTKVARKVAKARQVDGSPLATTVANTVARALKEKARKVAKARRARKARTSMAAVEKEKVEM